MVITCLSCITCNEILTKNEFSKAQFRKKRKVGYPRCKECIVKELDIVEFDNEDNIPPKRLTFIYENGCDFCDNFLNNDTTLTFVDFNLYPHTGWQVCKKCDLRCQKNIKLFYIEKDILQKKFPDDNFKVLRSSGEIEIGWNIAGNAIRYDINGDYTITIYNKKDTSINTIQKVINLKLLESWQT